jgi:hypothetical protein
LAYAVLDQIDAHPETWQQGSWDCGTAACFAGWAVRLSGGTIERLDPEEEWRVPMVVSGLEELNGLPVDLAADKLLGISVGYLRDRDLPDPYDGLRNRESLGETVAEIFGPRPVDWNKPLEPVMGVPASGCDCGIDGGNGLAPWPDRSHPHAEDCPAYRAPDDVPPNAGSAS